VVGRHGEKITMLPYYKFFDNPLIWQANYEEINAEPYLIQTIANAPQASLWGINVNYTHQLASLGNAFNALAIRANYSFNHSTTSSEDQQQDGLPLTGSTRHSLQLNVTFAPPKHSSKIVVASNYRGQTLSQIQDGEPIYLAGIITTDIAAESKILKNITLYTSINNLTNPIIESYRGKPNQNDSFLYSSKQYGSWAIIGLRWQAN
ncbi:MAG: TonB-dependent receptor, partial [Bacteroidota bacterium]